MVVAVRGKMRGAMIHPIVASPVFFQTRAPGGQRRQAPMPHLVRMQTAAFVQPKPGSFVG